MSRLDKFMVWLYNWYMKLNSTVSKRQQIGTFSQVLSQVKDFEGSFFIIPITEPAIDNQKAVINTYGCKYDEGEFYSFVSGDYNFLSSTEVLSSLFDILEKNGGVDNFTAVANWSRQLNVILSNNHGSNPINKIIYINSYDKKLRESIIIPNLMLKLEYMHRKSGKDKVGFKELVDFLNEEGTYEIIMNKLKDVKINEHSFESLTKNMQLPVKKILSSIFNVNKETLRENKDHDDLFLKLFSAKYGMTIPGIINFTNNLYTLYLSETSYDKAAILISNISSYVTKRFLKPLGLMSFF